MKDSRTCHCKMLLWYKDYFELKATKQKKKQTQKLSALPTAFYRTGRIILKSPETTLYTALGETT